MLNLASFGPDDHQLLMQAGIDGLRDILGLDRDAFRDRVRRAATGAERGAPGDLTIVGLVGSGADARGLASAARALREDALALGAGRGAVYHAAVTGHPVARATVRNGSRPSRPASRPRSS